ncbi:hypothetical protein REIP_1515 [Rickettsia endosymbiont of Ixodes pacificus]|nr:hypothetical protein REIP_1515 [Rickettsia endosymbiont of Ixodes pacificus]
MQENDIKIVVIMTVDFRPILSPIQPNNKAPKGLKIKVEQKEKAARRRLT